MSEIVLVAAVAENGMIGRNGAMPWHLPADLAHFKRVTMGHPVVMGRRTYEAIGRALPGRRNIVVTRNPRFSAPGVEAAPSLDRALALAGDAEQVMIIGGAELYRAALPLANRIHLTRVHARPEGDTRFPELDASEWREVSCRTRPTDPNNAFGLSFIELQRAGGRTP